MKENVLYTCDVCGLPGYKTDGKGKVLCAKHAGAGRHIARSIGGPRFSDNVRKIYNKKQLEQKAVFTPDVCNVTGCKNAATNEVRLSLAVNASHPPALSNPVLHICDDHADVSWSDVMTEEGWSLICKGFTSMGRQAPKKEFSSLIIQPKKSSL